MIPAIMPRIDETPLELLRRCGGYYECPRDANGKRLGPLAGYAGKYDDGSGNKKQFVGDVYANFAKAERHAPVLQHFAEDLECRDELFVSDFTGFIGAPEGGKALAVTLALLTRSQYIFPEKKVVKAATETSREESVMVFDRHEPAGGTTWWLVEDVVNNVSTPRELAELMKKYGARFAGILCFLNRSAYDEVYTLPDGQELPIISVVRKEIAQYRQDDPAVADDIANNNVVWKPKNDWHRFEEAMTTYTTP